MGRESFRGSLLLIADDLGARGRLDRHRQRDFAASFAAEGIRDLERYLASWAAYREFLDREVPPNH